jgi:hypothetical protein
MLVCETLSSGVFAFSGQRSAQCFTTELKPLDTQQCGHDRD